MRRLLPWTLPVLLGLSLLELGAHAAIRSHVPSAADYAAAADYVRAEMGAHDAISAAPEYIDPLVRMHLGDRIDLAEAGRSDLAAYGGLWGIALGDARPADAPATAPGRVRHFGPLTVSYWALPAPTVLLDFVQALPTATVTVADRRCRLRTTGPPRGGGLGKGAIPPPTHFDCGERDAHRFVGAVVVEDLDLRPRHCVWQHPFGREPLSVVYRDVPIGERIVVYGGLYYEHERMRRGTPVHLRVFVDGHERGHMEHVDGDGWSRIEVPTDGLGGGDGHAEVRFEVTTARPHRRGFCWQASSRSGR